MKKSSRTMGKSFERSFRKCRQKTKSYFPEPNGNSKKLKKNVSDERIEKSRCSQRLKPSAKCRVRELSRSLTEKNVSMECGKLFQSASYMEKHFSSNISDKTIKCKFCSKAFRHHNNLKMHYRVHLKDKPFSFGKSARPSEDESHRSRHFMSYSLRKRIASNKDLNAIKLNDSQKKTLSTYPKYKPLFHRIGVKAMRQNFQLKKHIVMQKENTFSCSMCKKSFKRKDHLEKHFIIHTGDRPFSCGTCKKLFKRKDHLKRHFSTHIKTFSCGTCGKTFARKLHLKKHFDIHSSDKPFSCYECMKGFKQKNHLKLHNRIHLKDGTFSCKKCRKTFKQEINLKRHFLIHSRKNVFAKNKQGRKFQGKTGMKRRLGTNREDNTFELKAYEKVSKAKDQTRLDSSAYTRDQTLSRETCDKDFNHKYELASTACTHSKSKSHDCCTPHAIQEDNRQLEEQVCADVDENSSIGNTQLEKTTVNELMINMTTNKEENSQDSCSNEKKNTNYTELIQMKSTDIFEYSVICSYCEEKFKRHGDLQRHLRVHRLSLKVTNNTEALNKASFVNI